MRGARLAEADLIDATLTSADPDQASVDARTMLTGEVGIDAIRAETMYYSGNLMFDDELQAVLEWLGAD